MKRKLTLIIAVSLVCVGAVLGVLRPWRVNPAATVSTAVVARGDIVKTVYVDGNLVMPDKASLSFGVTGKVTEVLVEKGANVTKGQLLAKLDARSLQSTVGVAELQVEIAEAQVKAARAQYEIAVINLKNAPTPTQEKVLREQVEIAEANWEAARRSLEVAELNLESAKLNLEKATLVAPFAGVVADITITEGQEISATALASPAIILVNTGRIEMVGFVDELDIAAVKVGQEASIALDSLPDVEVKGRITFISPIGTNRAGVISYATTIALNNTSPQLKDGMSATAEIIVDRRDNVLLVPYKAIQGTWEKPVVQVLLDGQIKEREVTLGLSDGTNTEVLSGLEEGEKVVLRSSGERPYSFFDIDSD